MFPFQAQHNVSRIPVNMVKAYSESLSYELDTMVVPVPQQTRSDFYDMDLERN